MTLQIVCQNCGAKYKLPATFAADKAKCKACGSVIDVAAQRDPAGGTEAAAPAAATPAAARPAKARSDDGPAPRRATAGSRREAGEGRAAGRSSARRARGGDAGDDGGDGGRPRRGRAATEKKKGGNPALLWGGIGLVAVIAVVLVFVLGGGGGSDPAATDQTAANGAAAGGQPVEPPAKPAADGAAETPAPASGGAKPEVAGDPPAAAGGAAEESAPKPEPKPEPKPRARGEEITDPSQVFDPKTGTEPLAWPEGITAEERSQAEAAVATIVEEGTGFRVDRAKSQLRENAYAAVFAIVDALRNFDYFDADQSRTAYSLHELLRAIHDDKMNANYRVPLAGVPRDEMVLKDVDHNAKCVRPWIRQLQEKYQTREDFQAELTRLKSQPQKN